MNIADLERIAQANRWCADGTARELREQAGLSQEQIAEVVGVTHGAVSRWESGARMARTNAALHYARLLDRLDRDRRQVSW